MTSTPKTSAFAMYTRFSPRNNPPGSSTVTDDSPASSLRSHNTRGRRYEQVRMPVATNKKKLRQKRRSNIQNQEVNPPKAKKSNTRRSDKVESEADNEKTSEEDTENGVVSEEEEEVIDEDGMHSLLYKRKSKEKSRRSIQTHEVKVTKAKKSHARRSAKAESDAEKEKTSDEDTDNGIVSEEEEEVTKEDENPRTLNPPILEWPSPSIDIPCGTVAAEAAFKWLIDPIPVDYFYENIFEKSPHHINRAKPFFYDGLFVLKDFDKILKENRLNYDNQIDIVAYVNGERKPVESGMNVHSDFVWNAFQEGNSIRMRNPQAYHKPLWQLCSLLQEYFTSSVGANMYLTPPNTQGFPPHYDDIDAFILQIEGKKQWKVYKPRSEKEKLPKSSSGDLDEASIGTPCLEKEISAGDMLYIPRGFIHQAKASDEHSLHITISTNQLNTWSDFLHMGLEDALEHATEKNVEFRKSLPKDYFNYLGKAFAPAGSAESLERMAFQKKIMTLSKEVMKHFSIDDAADSHATDFIHASMPPCFNKKEAECSIHGNGNRYQGGILKRPANLTPDCKVRWIRKRAFRLVVDENGARLFHTLANSKNSKEEDVMFTDVDDDVVPAISALFKKHPEYIAIKDLPIDGGIPGKMIFAEGLYYAGFLVTDKPLPSEIGFL